MAGDWGLVRVFPSYELRSANARLKPISSISAENITNYVGIVTNYPLPIILILILAIFFFH
jgi:hypothetical protein